MVTRGVLISHAVKHKRPRQHVLENLWAHGFHPPLVFLFGFASHYTGVCQCILALFRNTQAAAVHEGTNISLLPDAIHHSITHDLEEINRTRKPAVFL